MSGFAAKDLCYVRIKWGARPRAPPKAMQLWVFLRAVHVWLWH